MLDSFHQFLFVQSSRHDDLARFPFLLVAQRNQGARGVNITRFPAMHLALILLTTSLYYKVFERLLRPYSDPKIRFPHHEVVQVVGVCELLALRASKSILFLSLAKQADSNFNVSSSRMRDPQGQQMRWSQIKLRGRLMFRPQRRQGITIKNQNYYNLYRISCKMFRQVLEILCSLSHESRAGPGFAQPALPRLKQRAVQRSNFILVGIVLNDLRVLEQLDTQTNVPQFLEIDLLVCGGVSTLEKSHIVSDDTHHTLGLQFLFDFVYS